MHNYLLKTAAAIGICTVGAVFLTPKILTSQPSPDLFQRISSALEAYALDHNGNYPPDNMDPPGNPLVWTLSTALTTPVAYLAPDDLIDPLSLSGNQSKRIRYVNFDGSYRDSDVPGRATAYQRYYALHGSWLIWSGLVSTANPATGLYLDLIPYDPTNGAQSRGSIFRSQKIQYETGVSAGTE